jgi:hypothetical protein
MIFVRSVFRVESSLIRSGVLAEVLIESAGPEILVRKVKAAEHSRTTKRFA